MTQILKTGDAIQRPGDGQGAKLTTFIPIRLKKRGGRKVIVPPSGNPGSPSDAQRAPGHDTAMQTALSRAFHWQRLLDDGVVASGVDIARREDLHPSTVNELLRLTLLAPQIILQIQAGKQPRILSLIWLKDNPLPQDWAEQMALFRDFDA